MPMVPGDDLQNDHHQPPDQHHQHQHHQRHDNDAHLGHGQNHVDHHVPYTQQQISSPPLAQPPHRQYPHHPITYSNELESPSPAAPVSAEMVPESGTSGDNSAPASADPPAKRKLSTDDGINEGKRSRRNRYTSIACNQCKRRKIKCNGETPCQRCGIMKLDCLYVANCCAVNFRDSEEFRLMSGHMTLLQDQVNNLSRSVSELLANASRGGSGVAAGVREVGEKGAGAGAGAGKGGGDARPTARLGHSERPLTSLSSGTPPPPPASHADSLSPSSSITLTIPPSTSAASATAAASSKQPYRGPASTVFSLDVARNTMHNMGYKSMYDEVLDDQAGGHHPPSSAAASAAGQPLIGNFAFPGGGGGGSAAAASAYTSTIVHYDPLCDYDLDEIVRLLRFYDEEIGIMYPFLDIDTLESHARSLYPAISDEAMAAAAAAQSGRARHHPLLLFNDQDTLKLKLIMCCSMAVEESNQLDRAVRLFGSIEDLLNRMLLSEPSDLRTLTLLTLVAGYRWFSNDEILGWRTMGHIMRMCQELGLHTSAGLGRISDERERKEAVGTFWSIYTLDRRWAFATGLPYVMQDCEIDSHILFPDEFPYLSSMVTYSRLAAKVWRVISDLEPVLARELRRDEIEGLDQEILQWYETLVPEEVRIRNWDKEKATALTSSYNLKRLRLWTYLRLNQIRIWVYTPILHSATSIMSHPAQAQRVVELARDTIRYLAHINATTNIYRRMQLFYHQFLTSAIAVLFLASVHAPVKFSAACRDEFYVALELVSDLSAKSWVSQRLWKTIKSLKEAAPRFGMKPLDNVTAAAPPPPMPTTMTAARTDGSYHHEDSPVGVGPAAVRAPVPVLYGPPASLAPRQQQVKPMPSFSPHISSTGRASMIGGGPSAATSAPPSSAAAPPPPQNGLMLQSEMSRVFEGYVGFTGEAGGTGGGVGADGVDMIHDHADMGAAGEFGGSSGAGGSGGGGSGGGEDMFRIFRELY